MQRPSGTVGSGDGNEGVDIGVPATGAPGGAGSGGESSCGLSTYESERKTAEVIVVLDRSSSMAELSSGTQERKWDILTTALNDVISASNAEIGWGLKLFPEGTKTDFRCAANTIVPLIHVPVAEQNAPTVTDFILASGPTGTGTPTADAMTFAIAHLAERDKLNNSQKFILLATDGDPTCPDSTSGISAAVAAIAAGLKQGYPTFVIGVDTTAKTTVATLDQMAKAGGRPREGAPGTPSFYLASTQNELAEALGAITSAVATCRFDLSPIPPVPENIAVDFNGTRAPRDPAKLNGWDYTTADNSQLEVYGDFCTAIKNAPQSKVQIRYGCPNEPIPPMQ
jgi:hypothetical protein